jgi:hypothetical protein
MASSLILAWAATSAKLASGRKNALEALMKPPAMSVCEGGALLDAVPASAVRARDLGLAGFPLGPDRFVRWTSL